MAVPRALREGDQRAQEERGAVILAHNYQTPEIYHCVADYVGDSLQLAKLAAASDAEVIVQGGVHSMAETSKILNPAKTVLIPYSEAGCSLAASIDAADVRALRKQYPGVPIVAYVNTSAEVKAEVDICCTSSNAVKIVESLGVDKVIMLPDRIWRKTSRRRHASRSSPGRGPARCTSASRRKRCRTIAPTIRA